MEYKAIQFSVIQTDPSCWKWIILLDTIGTRSGVSLTRADAVLDAESAIDKALENGEGSPKWNALIPRTLGDVALRRLRRNR